MKYEIVKAKDHGEAIEKSQFFVGQTVVVSKVTACANGDGTFSVFPEIGVLQEKPKPKSADRKLVGGLPIG